jgi:hypothetical protein
MEHLAIDGYPVMAALKSASYDTARCLRGFVASKHIDERAFADSAVAKDDDVANGGSRIDGLKIGSIAGPKKTDLSDPRMVNLILRNHGKLLKLFHGGG